MCGKIWKDKIRNECFREHLGIALMRDKIRETRLRWFEHIQRGPVALGMKSLAMQVHGPPRERARLKRIWMEVVKIYLK